MIQAYSKRLLSPYTGLVQIVESSNARALSLDGRNWGIQFEYAPDGASNKSQDGTPVKRNYYRVANIQGSDIERIKLPPYLNNDEIEGQIHLFSEYLRDITLPFPAADLYEYWLLDEKHEQPLALIYSCVRAEQMALYPSRPEWTATPASVAEVKRTAEEQQVYTPPVNYQLEQLVNQRAGRHPRAAWIKRRQGLDYDFPPCLVSGQWEEEEHERLYRRYIERLAPRLLMLRSLDRELRLQLEQTAKTWALEVDQYFPLYPEVADEKLMSAIRVEARLRIAAGDDQR